jgi:hypothetical protein
MTTHHCFSALGFSSTLPQAIVLTILLLTIPLAMSCRRGDDATERAVNLDATCNQAGATIDLPDGAGVGLVIQVKRDSQCPVNVNGLSRFTGSITPGNVVQRSQETGADHRQVKLDCGDNKEMKCKYSYLKLTRPRQAATIAEEEVATKCDKGDTVISLGGGNFTVDVQVLDTSECPVDISGIAANPESLAPGTTKSFVKLVDAVNPPLEIKLSCGTSATKNCKYKYSLKKN